MAEIPTFRLSEFTKILEDFFAKKFYGRKANIIAEISSHKRYPSKRWHFFDVVEKAKNEDRLLAKMNAVAWKEGYSRIESFERETGQTFTDGIEVLLTCELSFTGSYGLKLTVLDIDASFTLGQLEQRKREVLRKLLDRHPKTVSYRDGTYVTANQGLLMPRVIKRVAVVSSPGAAGYEDFIHTLESNVFGYTFRLDKYYAPVQGRDAANMLTRRLAELRERQNDYDLIVMLRGGGAQTDLFVFDDYALNREIARMPVPLWTGIGHQRDITIADLFAHTSHKTPTRVAEAIVQHNRTAEDALLDLRERVLFAGRENLEASRSLLRQASLRLTARAPRLLNRRKEGLTELGNRVKSAGTVRVVNRRNELREQRQTLKWLAEQRIRTERRELHSIAAELGDLAQARLKAAKRELAEQKRILPSRALHILKWQKGLLGHASSILKMADPENILKRGFALIKLEGRVVADPSSIPQNQEIEIVTHARELRANVTANKKREA